jgi:glycosyltransferase involved in cell wall biosynthesis
MIKILGVSDFSFINSGIYSCLIKITNNYHSESFKLYTDQNIKGFCQTDLFEINVGNNDKVLIFTHIEYSNLTKLLTKYPNAVVYVCDWPKIYWNSVKKNQNYIKGLLGEIRFYYRMLRLPKSCNFIFVAKKDCEMALNFGFKNSKFIPLGIDLEPAIFNKSINSNLLCFTGNFRYEPNLVAAIELIEFARFNPDYKFLFAGYYANDLASANTTKNVILQENVSSIIDLLAKKRPIYVSNLKFGAGAKNKILEAVISGCPIIATDESLDESLNDVKSILIIKDINKLPEMITSIRSNLDFFESITSIESRILRQNRSWDVIANKLLTLLNG